jgi:exopolysaccharide biosynthesis polyprenyl glycosylphosphotransferase
MRQVAHELSRSAHCLRRTARPTSGAVARVTSAVSPFATREGESLHARLPIADPGGLNGPGVGEIGGTAAARDRCVDAATRPEFLAAFTGGLVALYEGSGGLALPIACALFLGALAPRRLAAPIVHLRMTRTLMPVLAPVLVVLVLCAADSALAGVTMSVSGWVLVAAGAGAAAVLAGSLPQRRTVARPTRVAFVGGIAAGTRLANDFDLADSRRFELAGRIAVEQDLPGGSPVVGATGGLRDAILGARIDVIVLGNGVPRMTVFDEFADSCLDLRVRISELPAFYEEAFGHVAVPDINGAWFAQLADGHVRPPAAWIKRALDLALSAIVGALSLPVLALLALLIRRDGGPALFAQTRIGEHGRAFRIYKLRTMRISEDERARWATVGDPRITRLGTVLRRTHLDELPQLWNILRGEMSFVGPRPEQAPFVDHLERVLPFYQRRHLIRPGLTGWAQVRCGYAGSDADSALKLCNDLYYYKHRSLALDMLVLGETAWQILLGRWGGRRTVVKTGTGADPHPMFAELTAAADGGVLDAA